MVERRGRVTHWIPANHANRIPRRHVYLTTGAITELTPTGESHTLRLAVAAADIYETDTQGWQERKWVTSSDNVTLWEWISAQCRSTRRTILWAHGLAVDLRLTDAFHILPSLGWTLKKVRLDARDASATWSRNGATLLMTDLHSWAPKSLAQIAAMVDAPLSVNCPEHADSAGWETFCQAQTNAIATAARRIIEWVETENLGNWAPTGASQAWAAWRHRFYTDKVLCHDNADALDAERVAVWAGRAEAWRHGRLPRREWTDMDMASAYGRICRDVQLPVRLLSQVRRPSIAEIRKRLTYGAVLAELEVTTETPILPCRIEGRVLWPVGTFRTTVWDPEWSQALAYGAEVTVRRAWVYRRAPALSAFASWALDVMADPDGNGGAFAAAIVKQMTRTLIGRFGVSYSDWEPFGPALTPGVGIGKYANPDDGTRGRTLTVGNDMWLEGEKHLGDNASPAVMGYVMSQVRADLWESMNIAGLDHVAYCDTDGMIVDPFGRERLESAQLFDIRAKEAYRAVWIGGPRQLQLDGGLKAAGVPAGAARLGQSRWGFTAWQSLAQAIETRNSDTVIGTDRAVRVGGVDNRRTHCADGLTDARRVTVDSLGVHSFV